MTTRIGRLGRELAMAVGAVSVGSSVAIFLHRLVEYASLRQAANETAAHLHRARELEHAIAALRRGGSAAHASGAAARDAADPAQSGGSALGQTRAAY